ncbi:non-ribosomal peptide synthetase [Streptomyces sp. HNM0663]|uniref:Non-ribosomal peptide synthetase n=1 Tax=Streptomyces chengmaiensis TaxID=3040919 RepID=A0ABT6HQX7_9ACTN|nr:non-ribosomal peptide synthetase [Streptomyces chengmaiensis]MDH2391122.1 non-ribosomal peptide synthetase [Streptomyces chengmaiensis]
MSGTEGVPAVFTADQGDGMLALITDRARSAPRSLAVSDGTAFLTYEQLTAAAGRLAGALRERGVRPGAAVGMLLPHSVRTVVAQLAVWWAGGSYVPLDAGYPRSRTQAMLADTDAVLTVGDKNLLEAAGIPAERALALPRDVAELPRGETPEPAAYEPSAPAYVLYTSGSTGRPKGVAVPHRAVAALAAAPGFTTLTARDRVLFHSPLTFDASVFEVWAPLANGAAVAVSTADRRSLDDLSRDVERLGATVALFTTALFHHLAARQSPLFSVLRGVLVGGEALSAQHARTVLRAHPWLELVNVYGPTEATVFATAHRVREADCAGPPPIGRPVQGATAHVLDAQGEPVSPGAVGELWIGGPRLALGYLGQPERTAECFAEHPVHGRLYRSGDLVSVRADGVLDFHGRADDQLKVRGFRIEPGEVEHALRTHPDVADAAVVVQRRSEDDARLTAFVVPGARRPDPVALRDHAIGLLPAHMAPGAWAFLDALPLTGSGKVDRRALAERPAGAAQTAPEGVGPALSPIERAVAELWGRALEQEVDRADADFFDLGGHSLLALVIVDDLREELGVELTLPEFFADPTVAGQAQLVEQALRDMLGEDG